MTKRTSVIAALLTFGCCLFTASASAAPLLQWTVVSGGNGHFYEGIAVPERIDWYAAQAAAIAKGGYLATITSAAENTWVFTNIASDIGLWSCCGFGPWLGGFQPAGSSEPGGGWQWVNGEGAFAYTNWASGEPNNAGGEESLHYFNKFGSAPVDKWNDLIGVGTLFGYIVEYDSDPSHAVPEPASLTLLFAGIVGLLSKKVSSKS